MAGEQVKVRRTQSVSQPYRQRAGSRSASLKTVRPPRKPGTDEA